LNICNFHLEVSEFAPPGEFETLYCKARQCANCGKCRDWYYTADLTSWRWIQNVENWTADDWKSWSYDCVWERFKRRDDATCTYHDFFDDVLGIPVDRRFIDLFLGRDRFFGRRGRFGGMLGFRGHDFCVCDDNRRQN
jgi:hypothetical protein